jgi:acyl-CoA thioesterase I
MKKILIILCFLFTASQSGAGMSSDTTTIMVLGDSLSTSYNMPTEAGWVNLLRQRLRTYSPDYQVINISISGETTLGGRNRIDQAIQNHQPNIVMIGLGGNDGLRGSPITNIYDNLEAIIKTCLQNNITVILLGMQIPPNYGIPYTQKFRNIYPRLAEHYQLELVPFLLAGFGDNRDFFQSDGIHPNILAQELIVENVWTVLSSLLHTEKIAASVE